jgi:arylsulfatase A-like enzyme
MSEGVGRRAFLGAMGGGWLAQRAGGARRPNVVFVLADDLGFGDAGCFGGAAGKIATPHIDALAASGMRFTDAHAPAAWCVPSRAGLLTGRYPLRLRPVKAGNPVIQEGGVTMASHLRQAGYATAMVGKWHLGFDGGPEYDLGQPLTGGPLDRGFDRYFGIPASLDIPPYYYIRDRRPEAAPLGRVGASASEGWSPIQGAFWREGGMAAGFRHEDVLGRLEQEAVRTIDGHARDGGGQPLFLYLALTAPHTPWLPAERYRGKSGAGLYGDFTMQTDGVVGSVVQALERNGMRDDTLIFFTSDNGPVWYEQDAARFGHRAAGPWRGMKMDSWEGGHRTPFVASWKGRIAAGSTSRQLIGFTDVMATVGEMVGAPVPKGAGEDSVSFARALLGKDGGRPIRDHLVIREQATVLRQGPWKLIQHLGSGGFTPPSKVAPGPDGVTGQLYDLESDPGETRNLWGSRPELVRAMSERLKPYQEARARAQAG